MNSSGALSQDQAYHPKTCKLLQNRALVKQGNK